MPEYAARKLYALRLDKIRHFLWGASTWIRTRWPHIVRSARWIRGLANNLQCCLGFVVDIHLTTHRSMSENHRILTLLVEMNKYGEHTPRPTCVSSQNRP